MPAERELTMRQLRQTLRRQMLGADHDGVSVCEIASFEGKERS
jgi:hypothetical protein